MCLVNLNIYVLIVCFCGNLLGINGQENETFVSSKILSEIQIIPPGDFNGMPADWTDRNITAQEISFVFFYGNTNESFELSDASEILRNKHFDKHKRTLFYFYGYTETIEKKNTQIILNAYLNRGDHNIIIIDYENLVNGDYFRDVVPNLHKISPPIAQAIYEMHLAGLNLRKTHFVGHSLGVHIAGATGNDFKELALNNRIISRISGLDPAFPLFYPPYGRHITGKDASFVDIIHTDAMIYGAPVRTGTADFWPNNGRGTQPGCPTRSYVIFSENDLCSHHRSVLFWAESLEKPKAFLSIRCRSWMKFIAGACSSKSLTFMGIDARPGNVGDYFLQTNGDLPFSRNSFGVLYRSV